MLYLVLAASIAAAPNVVFLSVDTLRADHLGCYGYEHDTSPNLDRLARESRVYDDAVCEIPLTSPSFCAMLSSQYPRVTGSTRNGLPLPDGVVTAPQLFQAAGYHTVCVQSNWTLKTALSGLDRGFDVYDDGFHKKRWGFIKSERRADEVTRIALEQLQAWDQEEPLFAWFHYSDPHAPYKMHRKFNVAREGTKGHRGKSAEVRRKYDSEIAYTDFHIGRLLEALPKENTFILFVGDHGESLYEHDYLGHGRRIYQTGLRIPFMLHGPGIEPGRLSVPVRGIDVGPTLLAMAGLAANPDMAGLNLLGEVPDQRARVVETYGGAVLRVPGVKSIMANKPPQLQGALLGSWKLILEGDRALLFDLARDPMEEEDRSKSEPERVKKMTRLIRVWHERTERGSAVQAELTEDDLEALEALGYVD